VNRSDARLWHPWLRINRVLRVMLQTRWSALAWSVVRVELRRALAPRSQIRRAGTLAVDVRRAASWSPRSVRHTINHKVAS